MCHWFPQVALCFVNPAPFGHLNGKETRRHMYIYVDMADFPQFDILFGGSPIDKDHHVLGSRLGSPYFGELPYRHTWYK